MSYKIRIFKILMLYVPYVERLTTALFVYVTDYFVKNGLSVQEKNMMLSILLLHFAINLIYFM